MSENCSPLAAPTGGRAANVCAPVVTTMRSNPTRRWTGPHPEEKKSLMILRTATLETYHAKLRNAAFLAHVTPDSPLRSKTEKGFPMRAGTCGPAETET